MSVGKKLLFWFFKRWNLALGKTKCAICVVAFSFQQDFFRSGLVGNDKYMSRFLMAYIHSYVLFYCRFGTYQSK